MSGPALSDLSQGYTAQTEFKAIWHQLPLYWDSSREDHDLPEKGRGSGWRIGVVSKDEFSYSGPLLQAYLKGRCKYTGREFME